MLILKRDRTHQHQTAVRSLNGSAPLESLTDGFLAQTVDLIDYTPLPFLLLFLLSLSLRVGKFLPILPKECSQCCAKAHRCAPLEKVNTLQTNLEVEDNPPPLEADAKLYAKTGQFTAEVGGSLVLSSCLHHQLFAFPVGDWPG